MVVREEEGEDLPSTDVAADPVKVEEDEGGGRNEQNFTWEAQRTLMEGVTLMQ